MLKAEIGSDTVYYTRGFELISRREGATASYYIYDGGLSIRALTNEAGIVTDTLVFDAFGNETGRTGSSDNPYGFQGEEQDDTGLYYLRARYMDPSTGTFTTMDTYGGSLSDPMSLHKYLFANSNPVMYSDPSGHSASLIETGAVMGIMSILSGSANAIIAEFIYKNNTDVSERSSEDLDKCALTAFLSGFTTCLFSCLATFLVCVFAFTVLECLMAAAICSLIAWMLGDIADYNHRNGNEDLAIGLNIAQQAFISAEIGFVICGLNGGGQTNAPSQNAYPTKEKTNAIQSAEEICSWPKSAKKGINTVAVVETHSGCYFGVNQERVYNETVQQILDVLGVENGFGRQCAEINAISKAMNEGANLDNAFISIANVRGPNSMHFGTSKAPCDVCQGLIDFFGIFVLG